MSSDFAEQFFFDYDDWCQSCQGKTQYENEWQAQFAADECFEKSRGKTKLSWYKCKHCGKWHLTSR